MSWFVCGLVGLVEDRDELVVSVILFGRVSGWAEGMVGGKYSIRNYEWFGLV